MSVELLILGLACAMTMLAYMIAINAHGPTRLSLSYFLATMMLAGTVWAIVKYVNTDIDTKKMETLKKLEAEKKQAEERVVIQEVAYKENVEKMNLASRLNAFISKGTALAATMINVDLQDKRLELNELVNKTGVMNQNIDVLKKELSAQFINIVYFQGALKDMQEATKLLSDAAYYYKLFYTSEDSQQEQERERLMRSKARQAFEKFKNVSDSLISK